MKKFIIIFIYLILCISIYELTSYFESHKFWVFQFGSLIGSIGVFLYFHLRPKNFDLIQSIKKIRPKEKDIIIVTVSHQLRPDLLTEIGNDLKIYLKGYNILLTNDDVSLDTISERQLNKVGFTRQKS